MQFSNQVPYFGDNTQKIISSRKRANDLYPDREECLVSRRSSWGDRYWIFDSTTPGTRPTHDKMVWDISFADGSNLLNPIYRDLLEELRRFVWSCYVDPRNSRALGAGSLSSFSYGIQELASWMVDNNYLSLSELDQRASERYLDSIHEKFLFRLEFNNSSKNSDISIDFEAEEEGFDGVDGVHPSWIAHLLMPWTRLWNQRSALSDAGVATPNTGVPFSGRSVSKLSHEVASRIRGSIPAIPDDLASDIMNAAQRYMDVASDDLINFSSSFADFHKKVHLRYVDEYARGLCVDFIRKFEFSISGDNNEPWHRSLINYKHAQHRFKKLIDNLIGAASVIVQSESGMRISEIMSLKAGINAETDLPSCISIRPSRSGMLDLFYINGRTSKMRANPEETEWLLAARPRGSELIPSAVKAISVVQQIIGPWREIAYDQEVRDLLFVGWGRSGTAFPRSGYSILPMSSQTLGLYQKTFISSSIKWRDIPDEPAYKKYKDSAGMCIISHQWRKNYARFVFQVNPKMIPAVARQFKHLSLAMTEQAYVGTEIGLIKDVAIENRNMTVDLLIKKLRNGDARHEGRMGKLIERYKHELAEISGDKHENLRAKLERWCTSRDLKIFFHGYGSCIPGLAPAEAECHKRENTVHWANKEPNYSRREPGVCTGCYLFMAGPENIDYWLDRYIRNMSAWITAQASGTEAQFHVAKMRAEQSASYLKIWRVNIPVIEFEGDK